MRKGMEVIIIAWILAGTLWTLYGMPIGVGTSSSNVLILILSILHEGLFDYSVSATIVAVIWTLLYTWFRMREKKQVK